MRVTRATKQTHCCEIVLLCLMMLSLANPQWPFLHLSWSRTAQKCCKRMKGGTLQNECQLSSCMETAENSGEKDLWDFLLPQDNCRAVSWHGLPWTSFGFALTVCWNISNERWSWKHKFQSGLLPEQRVVPSFLPELCEMAATFTTGFCWTPSLCTQRPSCKCV